MYCVKIKSSLPLLYVSMEVN